jgi:hypothetical protein
MTHRERILVPGAFTRHVLQDIVAVLDDLEERLTNLQRRFEAEEDYRMEQVEQNE